MVFFMNNSANNLSEDVKESLATPGLKAIQAKLQDFAVKNNTTPHALNPAQRREVILELSENGLMDLKHAHVVVAETLGVARSTIYTYLPRKDSHNE
jgi:predicted transcriptional regulator YheO